MADVAVVADVDSSCASPICPYRRSNNLVGKAAVAARRSNHHVAPPLRIMPRRLAKPCIAVARSQPLLSPVIACDIVGTAGATRSRGAGLAAHGSNLQQPPTSTSHSQQWLPSPREGCWGAAMACCNCCLLIRGCLQGRRKQLQQWLAARSVAAADGVHSRGGLLVIQRRAVRENWEETNKMLLGGDKAEDGDVGPRGHVAGGRGSGREDKISRLRGSFSL